jgi:hypothetical protein
MFGLKGKKESEEAPELFELEKEIRNPSKKNQLKAKVDARIASLKKTLREGGSEDEYDQYGVLLHAYASLQKLIPKVAKASKSPRIR